MVPEHHTPKNPGHYSTTQKTNENPQFFTPRPSSAGSSENRPPSHNTKPHREIFQLLLFLPRWCLLVDYEDICFLPEWCPKAETMENPEETELLSAAWGARSTSEIHMHLKGKRGEIGAPCWPAGKCRHNLSLQWRPCSEKAILQNPLNLEIQTEREPNIPCLLPKWL